MKKTYKNVLMSLLAFGVLTGCATKDVEYDGMATPKNNTAQTANDNKLDNIAGEENSVESANDLVTSNGADDTMSNSAEESDMAVDDGINKTKSDVAGQTVVLSSVHFAFDKYNLSPQMRDIATANASKIDGVMASYSNLKIKLEGNCDEWGTDEYNYALGLKRAKTAKDALVEDGIDPNKIMMVSFGESNPVCNEKNVDCWKLNRRVDYRLLP